ncbi:MAG: hypothetical protein EBT47_04590, partial [Chloroflexi bacterium]|nr:hypothetical protein [Chloroflexota bacterium]
SDGAGGILNIGGRTVTRNRKLAVGGAVTMIIGGLVGVVVLATTGPAVGSAQTVVAREMAYVPIDVTGVVGRPVTMDPHRRRSTWQPALGRPAP